jgi:hypothetical protein
MLILWLALVRLCSSWFHLRCCSTFSLSCEFGIWIMVGQVFVQVKVSVLVIRELRGALMICVGSLVGRSLLIRGRELVF